MDTLIIHFEPKADKSKVKEAIKMFKGVKTVSDKISKADFEDLMDDVLLREIKKAEGEPLSGYTASKKQFAQLRKKLSK